MDAIKSQGLDKFNKLKENKPAFYSVIIFLVIVFIVILIRKYNDLVAKEKLEPVFIRSIKRASSQMTVEYKEIPVSLTGTAETWSVWLTINQWEYMKDNYKHVFHKGTKDAAVGCPMVYLTPDSNSLAIIFANNSNEAKNVASYNPIVNPRIIASEHCMIVENIPLRRWFHLVIVINDSTIECYIDGKLYKTMILKGTPKFNANDLFVNLNRGYGGSITELRYFPRPLQYLEVYTMYSYGPTPFYFTNLLGGKLTKWEQNLIEAAAEGAADLYDMSNMLTEATGDLLASNKVCATIDISDLKDPEKMKSSPLTKENDPTKFIGAQ